MSQKISTKDEIVKIATKLLMERSYNSISYNDISDIIGIKKASIHYHFQTKDILGVEIIKNFRSKIEYLMNKLDESEQDPEVKLEKYFKYFEHGLSNNLICPGGVFAVEYITLANEIKDEVHHLFECYIDWLEKILKEGKNLRKFNFTQTCNEKAWYIASIIEGALIFARSFEKPEHYKNIVNQVKSDLKLN